MDDPHQPTHREPDPATIDRLEHVIDDTDGREDAVTATVNKLLAGATFEEVTAELTAAGWSLDAAESIVEEAREATKRQRGVRTREDVVIDASRKFGKTIRRVRWIIIIGIVIVGIAVWMILNRGE